MNYMVFLECKDLYFYQGHFYKLEERTPGSYILRCSTRRSTHCKAKIFLENLNRLDIQHKIHDGPHIEKCEPYSLLKENFKSEVISLCKTTFTAFFTIFREVKGKDV